LNINITISKGISYAIVIFLYSSAYFGLILFVDQIIKSNWVQPIISVAMIIFAGVTFNPLRLHLQTVAEKAFFRDWNEFRRVLKKIAVGLNNSFTRKDIVKTIDSAFKEKADVSNTQILFLDKKEERYIGGALQ